MLNNCLFTHLYNLSRLQLCCACIHVVQSYPDEKFNSFFINGFKTQVS